MHSYGTRDQVISPKQNRKTFVSCYFIGYPERSRGFKFYDPTTKAIFETGNARFFEDVGLEGGDTVKDFVFDEEYIGIPTVSLDIDQVMPDIIQDNQDNNGDPPIILPEEQAIQPQEPMPLRRSTREKRSVISDNYIVFLHEADISIVEDDPITFRQAMKSFKSQ